MQDNEGYNDIADQELQLASCPTTVGRQLANCCLNPRQSFEERRMTGGEGFRAERLIIRRVILSK